MIDLDGKGGWAFEEGFREPSAREAVGFHVAHIGSENTVRVTAEHMAHAYADFTQAMLLHELEERRANSASY